MRKELLIIPDTNYKMKNKQRKINNQLNWRQNGTGTITRTDCKIHENKDENGLVQIRLAYRVATENLKVGNSRSNPQVTTTTTKIYPLRMNKKQNQGGCQMDFSYKVPMCSNIDYPCPLLLFLKGLLNCDYQVIFQYGSEQQILLFKA